MGQSIQKEQKQELGMTPEKTYGFYGWQQADVPPVCMDFPGIRDPKDLYDILSGVWCAETCAPRMRKDWTPANKTLGQCSITAFLVQDIFGGKVYGIPLPDGGYHCYNVVDGHLFDLTSEQFGGEALDYTDNPEQFREVHFQKEEKRLRYEDLKRRLAAAVGAGKDGRTIRSMEEKYLLPALDLVEDVFAKWDSPEEARTVRALVEEIRAKRYYLPELELIMTDANDQVIGYVMFSRFHIEGKYEDELLILTPAAVKTELQRQHISKELIEYGFRKARAMGFKAVLVEGDPRNYTPRGFVTSADHGIVAGPNIHLPHVSCLMIKELEPGALEHIHGTVDYSFYEALYEG